jgi:hypothetical protein
MAGSEFGLSGVGSCARAIRGARRHTSSGQNARRASWAKDHRIGKWNRRFVRVHFHVRQGKLAPDVRQENSDRMKRKL